MRGGDTDTNAAIAGALLVLCKVSTPYLRSGKTKS
jgi:ADP-ribosylglycohydrolase